MMQHHDFAPLDCNAGIIGDESTPCEAFSSAEYDPEVETVVVPCGTCLTMDLTGEATFRKGLDVQGKLVFPSDRSSLTIVTPFVFVQGELVVEELDEPRIPQPDRDLEFRFVGSDDVTFVSHPDQVSAKCSSAVDADGNGGGCNLSKKPFVVAGGSVDIRGVSEACATWTRVLDTVEAGPASATPVPAPVPVPGCSAVLVAEDFESSPPELVWDGNGAGSAVVVVEGEGEGEGGGYFSVSDRTSSTQGPRVYLPVGCIAPGEIYVARFRYRYRHHSTDKSEFGVPYLKLIRTKSAADGGGSDWLSPDEIHGRGDTAAVPVDEWRSMEFVLRFDDELADPDATSDLALYVAPYDDADAIDLDDFALELAPATAFEDRSCGSLLFGVAAASAADSGFGGFPAVAYPWHSNGGTVAVATTDDGDAPGGGGSYLRSTLRRSVWSSPFSHDLPAECLVEAAVYEFSADVRVHAEDPTEVSVVLLLDGEDEHAIVVCPPSAGDWVPCAGRIRLETVHEGAATAALRTRVLGGDETSDVDLANATLEYRGGRAVGIEPEAIAGVSDCWAPGAEVLVTSHTTQQSDAQIATVASVSEEDGILMLEKPVHDPISIADDPIAAVEIALLTRNVRFTAADDDEADPLHGGHFIVLHTPAPTTQTLVGIESRGFGQQGKLGRYPFHFHMCGSVAGSVLSKNSIRDTKQRGIVVHGSHDLLVEGNVLHNTKGHAVMLEDGAEQGNVFLSNLGAVGHPVEVLISEDESDNAPSTFWITNPRNRWIGNVAAGSEHSGFWFEVKTRVRGPSAGLYPDMIPNQLDLLEFTDNVSHSNAQGLQTYPQAGYRPGNLAVFRNHRSYRNRISGVFFHAGGRLSIEGGYLSDNPIGVDIDMDHSDVISDTVIVGYSPAYRAVLDDLGARADQWPARGLCSRPLEGIRLDSFHEGILFGATGTSVVGATFSGFGADSGCPGSSALSVDREDVQYFDTRNRLAAIDVTDDSPIVNLCDGEEQVAIRLLDDSVAGGSPGFIVSDTTAIRAHPDCASLPPGTCAAVCPGTCLRTMTVLIPSASTYARGALALRVTGTVPDGRPIDPIEVLDFRTQEPLEPDNEWSRGRFFATLPAGGSYAARVVDVDTGETIWPVFADLRYEDAVDGCGPDFASFEIETLEPEEDGCEQLVRNGSFESGTTEHWRYAGNFGFEIVTADGAEGSRHSLRTPNADGGGWVGTGQYLDTRCIEEGSIYTIAARVKLTDSATGAAVGCDLDSNDDDPCPKASFRFTNRLDDPQHHWSTFGYLETADGEWNTLSGSYVATEYAGVAHAVYMYITGVRKGVDIQIDDVRLTRSEASPAPSSVPTGSSSSAPSDGVTGSSSSATSSVVTEEQLDPEVEPPSLFEGSSPTSVFLGADGGVRLESATQEPSAVMSTAAHQDGPDGTLELVVTVADRDVTDSGWQPSLVLFFAPGSTPIGDVATPDNGFHNFEGSIAAYAQHRMFPGLGSYFYSKAKREDGTFDWDQVYADTLPLPTTGTALKLSRKDGKVRSFYSLDSGDTWTQIGGEYLLAPDYRHVPLKVGYRMYLEYKTSYRLETIPSITSGGEVLMTPPPRPQSYFDGTNADLDSATCTADDGCRVWGEKNVAKILSHETFEGDVVFVSEFTDRPMFGTGYQAGLWLFLAPADATLASIPDGNGAFRDYAVGMTGDKIYAPSDHTYIYSSSMSADGTSVDQYRGESWKNVDGYTKLQRVGGKIGAYVSPNGHTWSRVGEEIELPPELANAPVRLGYRVVRNCAPGYEFRVTTTISPVDQTEVLV